MNRLIITVLIILNIVFILKILNKNESFNTGPVGNMTAPVTSQASSGNFIPGSGKSCKELSKTNPNIKCTYMEPKVSDDSYINLDRELNSYKREHTLYYKQL